MKTASHKLALLAIVLGIVALLGEPQAGGSVRLNTQELAYIVEGKIDHVDVEELADWIVLGRSDYRLIDVRAYEDYASYHIPTAENVRLVEFGDYPLYRNEKIVLYSDGGIHAAQAWFLLQAQGYKNSYILLGGLELWKDEVLFPALAEDASASARAAFEKRRSMSAFFGGQVRTGAATVEETYAVPAPKLETAPNVVIPQRSRKQKEGC